MSGLVLKPTKCVLISLASFASVGNVAAVRAWLAEHVPERQDFKISNHGMYLVFQVGPLAGRVQWPSVRSKFQARVSAIQAQHEPAQLALRSYAVRAMSVFGYIAQLAVPPPRICQARAVGSQPCSAPSH